MVLGYIKLENGGMLDNAALSKTFQERKIYQIQQRVTILYV